MDGRISMSDAADAVARGPAMRGIPGMAVGVAPARDGAVVRARPGLRAMPPPRPSGRGSDSSGFAAPILRIARTPTPPFTPLAHRTAGRRASLSTREESKRG